MRDREFVLLDCASTSLLVTGKGKGRDLTHHVHIRQSNPVGWTTNEAHLVGSLCHALFLLNQSILTFLAGENIYSLQFFYFIRAGFQSTTLKRNIFSIWAKSTLFSVGQMILLRSFPGSLPSSFPGLLPNWCLPEVLRHSVLFILTRNIWRVCIKPNIPDLK